MGVSGQRHSPATLDPGKIPGTYCTGRCACSRADLDGCGKSPQPGVCSRNVQTVLVNIPTTPSRPNWLLDKSSINLETCNCESITKPCNPYVLLQLWLESRIHTWLAVSMPCRCAEGLDCVFPNWFIHCGRVWLAHAMPFPCRLPTMARTCPSKSDLSRPRQGRGRGMAWGQHSMCELASENDRVAAGERHGNSIGTAWCVWIRLKCVIENGFKVDEIYVYNCPCNTNSMCLWNAAGRLTENM
jgi:hypothetical protein